MDRKTRANIEHEIAQIEERERKPEDEKSKAEKRVTLTTAEERLNLSREFEKLTGQQVESYDIRR
jgi:hypothetical protein